MSRNEHDPSGRANPADRPISWRYALFGGLASLGLIAGVACGATTDSGDAVGSAGSPGPTRPDATTGAVTATGTPDAAALATRGPIATSARPAAPTRSSDGPTPTLRVAPTPTRILRATSTPFVAATRSLFATATPIPQVRATVVRPTATRFPTPGPTPFTGGGSGAGSSSIPTPTPGARTGGEARATQIQNFALESITISVGTTVTWTNLDSVAHTSTSGISPNFDGAFDSSSLISNGTFSYTFNSPGAFPYFCNIHPSMTGIITVQ